MNPRGGAFAGATACPSASGDDPLRPLINHGSTMHGGPLCWQLHSSISWCLWWAASEDRYHRADGQAAASANVTPRGFICIDGDGDGHDDGGRTANYTRSDGRNERANSWITAPRNEER
uniref:Uncharacterized protein n=1 Tax=Oryza rufipogon TaxID=4529 RepID=A0A0E0NUY7_ORYRU